MNESKREIVITDIKVPFLSILSFMIKLAIAAVPAMVVLAFLLALFSMIIGHLFGFDGYWHSWSGEGKPL